MVCRLFAYSFEHVENYTPITRKASAFSTVRKNTDTIQHFTDAIQHFTDIIQQMLYSIRKPSQ